MQLIRAGGFVALLWIVGSAVGLALEGPKLTELQQLKAQVQLLKEENLQLSYQLATCQARAQAATLAESRRQLDQDFTLPGLTFDWQTLTYTPK